MIHTIMQELTFLYMTYVSKKSNKLLKKENRYEISLKLNILRATFNRVLQRMEDMKWQASNAQLSSKLLIKACNLQKQKIKIFQFSTDLSDLEKRELIEQEMNSLTSEQIMLQDRRFQVYMLLKSILFEYYRKGVLSFPSFEIMSDACDKAVAEPKERIFWKSVANSLPSLSFLKKIDMVFRSARDLDFIRLFFINKLTRGFEIANVIQRGLEEVKSHKMFLDCNEYINDLVIEEFEEILSNVSLYPFTELNIVSYLFKFSQKRKKEKRLKIQNFIIFNHF